MEFKSSFNDGVTESLVAFANTRGGRVVIGIDEHGQMNSHFKLGKESLQNWVNEIKNKTQPVIIPDIEAQELNGSTIVVLTIQEFHIKPVSFKGRYYKRVKNSNQHLQAREIAELQFQSLNTSFDAILQPSKQEELNDDLIKEYFERVKQTARYQVLPSPQGNLEKLKFTINQQPTLAAILLFGNHNTNIHIGRFKSADTIMDDLLIKSPLVSAVEEAMHFIKKNIQVRFEFDGQLQRIEKWQYPLEAVRELLLNAIIHRDYHQPTDLIIKIFDDSITFINPGKLSPSLKIADLQTDNYLAVHRNKLLAEAFYLIGDVEKYGTGFIRIRKFLLSYPKMKLLIEELNGFIRATLATNETEGKSSGKSSGKIIQLILENKQITIPEIAEQLLLTTRSVEKQLANLRNAGIIHRVGSARGGYWEVKRDE